MTKSRKAGDHSTQSDEQAFGLPTSVADLGMSRRSFFGKAALGVGAAGLGLTQLPDFVASAQENETEAVNQTLSEHARKETLPKEAFDFPRWVPNKTGGFNLSDPADNHIAWAKVQANLEGRMSWLYQYGWIVLAPPNEPAYPLLGRLTLIQNFLTPAKYVYDDGVDENSYAMWGTFTTSHVNPRTFEAVDKIYNPYVDREIDVPTIHYADKLVYRQQQSIVVPGVDPSFYTQPWDEASGFSQHHIDTGDRVSYTVLGAAQKNGKFQPRCDVGFWTAKRSELMDPDNKSIDVRRDYSVIQKVYEYPWYGVERGDDQAQLLVHLTGGKVHNPAQLPDFIRNQILAKHTDRFVIDG